MTRHQLLKRREQARFYLEAMQARYKRNPTGQNKNAIQPARRALRVAQQALDFRDQSLEILARTQ